ncbi:MAG: DUF4910 domain-containing protein [Candidatus Omnitrophota bacterium]
MRERLEEYFDKLWPINRSIMGPGTRRSFDILEELVPFERLTFNTGDKVLDWEVPKEWNVNDAYFISPDGQKYCDFKANNLSLLGYSMPCDMSVDLEDLKKHLYTLKDLPNAIPYVTSYYKERWGFCIPYDQYKDLPDGKYRVKIDTELYNGKLEVAQAVLPGVSDKEILFSTYICHPSMANNELSGPLALCFLYEKIKEIPSRKFTYRFVVSSETIGTICYLSKMGNLLKDRLVAGYVLTCLADPGNFTYKLSRDGDGLVDRIAKKALGKYNPTILNFNPSDGSDERQYCSPGYNLPVGSLMRTKYGEFEQYHTSLDNKEFISFDSLLESINAYFEIVTTFETELLFERMEPFGEPQLGKRGLYRSLSTKSNLQEDLAAVFWILNLADGLNEIDRISKKSGIESNVILAVAEELKKVGLLKC